MPSGLCVYIFAPSAVYGSIVSRPLLCWTTQKCAKSFPKQAVQTRKQWHQMGEQKQQTWGRAKPDSKTLFTLLQLKKENLQITTNILKVYAPLLLTRNNDRVCMRKWVLRYTGAGSPLWWKCHQFSLMKKFRKPLLMVRTIMAPHWLS